MRRLVIFMFILLPLVACVPQEKVRMLDLTLPGAGVTSLVSHVGIGEVTIEPSKDADIHVSVSLKPTNGFFRHLFSSDESTRAIQSAEIAHTLDKGTLELGVHYAVDADAGIGETWHIAIPTGLHVESTLNIGDLRVQGIGGGVGANVNIGRIELDVPGGPLKASVNIGKIVASAQSLDYGPVDLAADVGDTRLNLNGLTVGDKQKQGSGSEMHYRAKGHDTIELHANTGEVTLSLSDRTPSPSQVK